MKPKIMKSEGGRKAPWIVAGLGVLLLLVLSACSGGGDGPGDADGDRSEGEAERELEPETDPDSDETDSPALFAYPVPLHPGSPWPKFRRDERQSGATDLVLTDDGGPFWSFKTGKGIFSSPVVGPQGAVYCGSADRVFYALNPDGTLKWSKETGEIIDSAALLDDRGRVYVGSGDGRLYAFDAETGEEAWEAPFTADDPEVNHALIRWFEGNVGIDASGTLIAGNDNFFIYGLDRDTGKAKWTLTMPDQTWALPAVDVERERLYVSNNNLIDLFGNVFAYDKRQKRLWQASSLGTIAASPLLLGPVFVVGGFDGYARAYRVEDGTTAWEFAAKDHIYASAALAHDGRVIQAATDGTVYSIDPDTGVQVWAFDWGAPLRSSPAVDGLGRIYVGSGDGRLVVLNPDGTLRWALRLIHDDRDDLNASPALGRHAVYIAGESGEIFGVPTDFCLRESEAGNPDCRIGPDEPMPADGVELRWVTPYGTPLDTPPEAIEANQALAFSLRVRREGETLLGLIDSGSLSVTLDPVSEVEVAVSADRRFLTVVPKTLLAVDGSGTLRLRITGSYLLNPERSGLATSGGEVAGGIDQTFTFARLPAPVAALPLQPPESEGAPAGAWELRRLAAPYPTLLPSYNQIGFDSLHFILSLVDRRENRYLGWVTEGRPSGETGETRIDPSTRGVFPVVVTFEEGVATLVNEQGFTLQVMNAKLSFNTFRLSARLNESGGAVDSVTLFARTICGEISLYGRFLRLLGLCHPETDTLIAYGAGILEPYPTPLTPPSEAVGVMQVESDGEILTARFAGSGLIVAAHSLALLVADRESRTPLNLAYGLGTEIASHPDGTLESLRIPYDAEAAPESVVFYLIVDGYPALRQEGTLEKGE